MSVTVLLIDGNDLSVDLGLQLDSNIVGHRDMVGWQRSTAKVPDKIARQLATVQVQPDVRVITVQGVIEATSLANLRSQRDTLKYRLNRGQLQAEFADSPGRHFRVYPEGNRPVRVTPFEPAMIQTWERVTISLVSYDPREYETAATNIGAFTADTTHALGTAPIGPVFTVTSQPFTLTYKHFDGSTLETFTVSGATGTAPFTVDMENQTVLDTNGISQDGFITGGDYFFLDPNDGDWEASEFPTVGCTVSTTTAYNKAYL